MNKADKFLIETICQEGYPFYKAFQDAPIMRKYLEEVKKIDMFDGWS